MPPISKYICVGDRGGTCSPVEVQSATVKATEPLTITVPAQSRFVLLAANAVNWSHDPLASAQNQLMLKGVSTVIVVDEKTKSDILSIVSDPKQIRIRADILKRAADEITAAVDSAKKSGGRLEIKSYEGDYGWVVSEIWKKYLQKRFPNEGLNKSFLGACGEPENYMTPQAPQSPQPVFLGDTPYKTGDKLVIGALIAINDQKHAMRFCQFGDMVENSATTSAKITLQINDGHLEDNSGHVSLLYYFEKTTREPELIK